MITIYWPCIVLIISMVAAFFTGRFICMLRQDMALYKEFKIHINHITKGIATRNAYAAYSHKQDINTFWVLGCLTAVAILQMIFEGKYDHWTRLSTSAFGIIIAACVVLYIALRWRTKMQLDISKIADCTKRNINYLSKVQRQE